ncbi:MAG: TolC family protein [Rhodospirillales bacterium]|nr:TolC family protein [Alphaproteobacteria bacterium]MCB9981753.1 TolC family protein [Rhodospirillales bacterium]
MKKVILTVLLSSVFLSGCFRLPEKPVTSFANIQKAPAKEQQWWRTFHDPLITNLGKKLFEQNPELKIALTRIEEARALRRINSSALFPDISGTVSTSRGNSEIGLTTPQTLTKGGFDTMWEADIFGANRAAIAASEARLQASYAHASDVRRIMIADLVQAIIEWQQARQILSKTEDLLTVQSKQVALLRARVEAGLINAAQLEQARAQKEQIAARIPLAKASTKQAQYQIERLLGQEPESLSPDLSRLIKTSLKIPKPDDTLNKYIDVVRDRPDVRVAAFNLQEAQADLRKAEADLWPRITFSAFWGIQKTSNGLTAVTASNPLWSLTNTLSAPLLNFGRLRGAVDAANVKAARAAVEYEKAVLLSLQEAKTAFSDYSHNFQAVEQQIAVLKHKQESIKLAKEQFERGLTDMTDVTAALAAHDEAAIVLINRQAAAALAYIRWQKALGV